MNTLRRKGEIKYDDQHGHVCTCTEAVTYDDDGYPEHASYLPTVTADRHSGTETGSYWYSCEACGAGTWSGV